MRMPALWAWWLSWLLAGAAAAAPCGDVDRSGGVNAADATALRHAVARLQTGVAAPGNCNLKGGSQPYDDDGNGLPDECTLVDLVVLRRALVSQPPGLRDVCAGDDFAAAPATNALSVRRNSRLGVRVTLYRHVAFAGEVTVEIAQDVPGVSAGTLVFPPDLSEGVLDVEIHPLTPLGAPIEIGLVARSGALTRSAPLTLTMLEEGPTTRSLIEAARAAGTIDYGTSLLYRAYALHGDSRLPAQYRGSGKEREDAGLWEQIETAAVPPALRAQLDAFVVRPGQPGSVYGTATPPALPPPGAPLPPPDGPTCEIGELLAVVHPTHPVRVHTFCRHEQDARSALETLAFVIGRIDRLWGMTALMGAPRPDLSADEALLPPIVEIRGGGPEIDVYVMDEGDLDRDDLPVEFGETSTAYSRWSLPRAGVRSSGYVVLNRDRLTDSGFYSDLVHEFFHVLQMGHNQSIQFLGSGENAREWWFTEASATWAESFYAPETARDQVHGARFPQSDCETSGGGHSASFESFQCNDAPLNLSVDSKLDESAHMYAAYVWPFFMEQEAGPASIAAAWSALSSVATESASAAMTALAGVLSFETNFRRFAVRNLNTTFPPESSQLCGSESCSNPIGTRYVDLGAQGFQPFDGSMPRLEEEYDFPEPLPPDGAPRRVPEALQSLKASYYHFTVSGGGDPFPDDPEAPGRWELDFSELSPLSRLGIDVVVRTNDDEWEWRQNLRPDTDGKLVLCDVWEVYLVLSNGTFEDQPVQNASRVDGTLKVRPLQASCACNHVATVEQWNATTGFSWSHSGANENAQANASHQGTVSFRFDLLFADARNVTWEGVLPTGSVSYNDHSTLLFDPPIEFHDQYSGPPDPDFFGARLSVDLETCEYTFTTFTEAGGPQGGARALPGGDYRTDPPASLALTGSGSFPAWTRIPTFDDGYAMGGGGTALALVIQPPPGGNPFGVIPDGETTALANWNFVPIQPPP